MEALKPININYPSRRVHRYTLDGIYIDMFDSARDAAKFLGKSISSNIGSCAMGKRKSAGGYR